MGMAIKNGRKNIRRGQTSGQSTFLFTVTLNSVRQRALTKNQPQLPQKWALRLVPLSVYILLAQGSGAINFQS